MATDLFRQHQLRMSRGQRFLRLEPETKEPSNRADMEYYQKFKEASEEEVMQFVAWTEGKSNADIVAGSKAFVVKGKVVPTPKPDKKTKSKETE